MLFRSLGMENDFQVIIEATTVGEAIKQLSIQEIDIAIINLSIGQKEDGLEVVERAKAAGMTTKFLVFTSLIRSNDIERARTLGVEGYIHQDATKEDICYAINSIVRGKKYYLNRVIYEGDESQYQKVKSLLTDREYEVFKALGKGRTNSQIAEVLFITEATVKKHISSILAKLELANRTEAALYAARLWRRKEDWY